MNDNEKRSADSSLELLLDTMCNTFGGVMFIAIAIVVLSAMLSPFKQEAPDAAEEAVELQNEIALLRKQLQSGRENNRKLEKIRELLKNDARAEELEELARLQTLRDHEQLRQSLAASQFQAVKLEFEARRQAVETAEQLRRERETELGRLREKEEESRKQQAGLREGMASRSTMQLAFTTLTERSERPYYLLLNDGKIWRVGPETLPEGRSEPNGDVEPESRDDIVNCRIRPGHGTPVFAGELLSPEFTALLQSIPKERLPYFQVGGKDAELFFRLRNQLKEQRQVHGFTLTDRPETLQYQILKSAKYEY
ncbi:MAG: hypothetical protein HPZ91_19675 [Lentisphaeria bacterium]|nr:hypothetical protein [Lentisphaeria bacterium]